MNVLAGRVDPAGVGLEHDQRTDGADLRPPLEVGDQRLQPAGADHDVHVEHRDVLAPGLGQGEVDRARIAAVRVRAEQPQRFVLCRQSLDDGVASVGGGVVHHQYLGRDRAGIVQQGPQAALDRVGAVVVDNDYGDQGPVVSAAPRPPRRAG